MCIKENKKNKKMKSLVFGLAPVMLGGVLASGLVYSNSSKDDADAAPPVKRAETIKSIVNGSKASGLPIACDFNKSIRTCFTPKKQLCEADMKAAKIAWKYFENNYQEKTGLFNAANNYPSTTMWDTGSALAATIAAEDFGIISSKEFDDKITALIKTLVSMDLFNGEAPNKVYNTKTMKMVTYANKVTPDGIGVSVLDLARLISWLNTLSCKHPKFKHQADLAVKRWDWTRLIKEGRMFSLKRDMETNKIATFQEGRLGYEQYAGKILMRNGYDVPVSATYNNENRRNVQVLDTVIATDNRTPNMFHSNNSVVTESYVMDAMENGYDEENRPLIDNVYKVQKQRWLNTGIVTAVSEDNINKKPYFVYNTIYSGGDTWVAKSSKGAILRAHKTVSTKAAIAMATLYPDDKYSTVLIDKMNSAYHPDKGWYSGIYENGEGYNTPITANTNGVILSTMLYKKYGSMNNVCHSCNKDDLAADPTLGGKPNEILMCETNENNKKSR